MIDQTQVKDCLRGWPSTLAWWQNYKPLVRFTLANESQIYHGKSDLLSCGLLPHSFTDCFEADWMCLFGGDPLLGWTRQLYFKNWLRRNQPVWGPKLNPNDSRLFWFPKIWGQIEARQEGKRPDRVRPKLDLAVSRCASRAFYHSWMYLGRSSLVVSSISRRHASGQSLDGVDRNTWCRICCSTPRSRHSMCQEVVVISQF